MPLDSACKSSSKASSSAGRPTLGRSSSSRTQQRRAVSVMASSGAAAAEEAVPDSLVALAHELADTAAQVTRRYFRTPVAVDAKSDASPVTVADREAEAAVRALITARCPDHAIFGEEQVRVGGHCLLGGPCRAGCSRVLRHSDGPACWQPCGGRRRQVVDRRAPRLLLPQGYLAGGPESEWLWVVDPIDGTKSFITGAPPDSVHAPADLQSLPEGASLVPAAAPPAAPAPAQPPPHPAACGTAPPLHRPIPCPAGKPLFGTLIALLRRGTPVLGIIDQPILRERWLGVAGRPSTLNGAPIATRACPSLGDAYLYATTPHMFAAGPTEQAFNRVRDAGECCLLPARLLCLQAGCR